MCARVGELARAHTPQNTLQLDDIKFTKVHGIITHMTVSFTNFKHNQKSLVHSIQIKPTHSSSCPVVALNDYLCKRGGSKGPLFQSQVGEPIPAQQVSKMLQRSLVLAGVNPKQYGTHSFRVGRCSEMARAGASNTQLRLLGCWHSDAFLTYVRVQDFSV